MKKIYLIMFFCILGYALKAQSPREHLLMDFNWKFCYGHAKSFEKDFFNGTSYFSYITKTGYGDGPASEQFDDRAWRKLDLPHDWAVEQPFSANASHSHGYKTVGWKYPENSLGWYRKTFFIDESDLGKKISIQFDGVFRNSKVWVNGFYLGTEESGYLGFEYDITDYLNYGGQNTIAVRVDASIEEGWYYEGAGIYRHVWLNKTKPLHVAQYGIFASSEINGNSATVTARTSIYNENGTEQTFRIEHSIVNANDEKIASGTISSLSLKSMCEKEYSCKINVENPKLWSPDSPYLYKLQTSVYSDNELVDYVETNIGIRSLRFDSEAGFFLNGKPLKIVGTNNHQDHAGVGVAIPDALQEFRITRLKEMGSNAYRCSHNPPTPELLDACDKLGMLVLDENRLMGINSYHLEQTKRMIMRDRNHPSVIAWSIGNEEWSIESNVKGARITETMQKYAQTLDSTRQYTVAVSGGCGTGSSEPINIMGFNYLAQCDIDEYHRKFPNQPSWGTEETSGCGSRGVYENDIKNGYMAQFDRDGGVSIERGWKFYDERPWLAGLFYWTGFDYRGEPNPLSWPAVSSQFGILDLCGFPKDSYYYLKANWSNEPVLHIFPHWNWKGKEGQTINVWAYSNCEEVELFLNKKSLGKKAMPENGHLAWDVVYKPGTLMARGFKNGKKVMEETIKTTGEASSLQLIPNKETSLANGEDVVVVTVKLNDDNGLFVPTADNNISFDVEGPGKIIGVGNGNSASHEPDKFIESITSFNLKGLQETTLTQLSDWPKVAATASWKPAFQSSRNDDWREYKDTLIAVKSVFKIEKLEKGTKFTLFSKNIVDGQSIYVNGHLIASDIKRREANKELVLDPSYLKEGENEYVATGKRFRKRSQWDEPNTDPGVIQIITPAGKWTRKAFNGLAQVIVQATKEPGEIKLKVTAPGLNEANILIPSQKAFIRPTEEVNPE